ncbi:MAG: A/G-specific adenine glycosylase [Herpetosiphon sp.]
MTIHPQLAAIQQKLLAWFTANGRDLPWRRTRDPYRVLVSEVMLQQTQVDRVKPRYAAFLEQFPTLDALADAATGDVIRAWSGLGYNRRALNLQRTAQAVARDYGGSFPSTPEELAQLPGIGPYTAGAVACFAFERDVAFMDTNIRRVIRRLLLGSDDEASGGDRRLLELAQGAVPPEQGWSWNQAVMELGALVCTASRPQCFRCPLVGECRAYAAWRSADEQVVLQPQVVAARTGVAERPAPFHLSSRFFRGRIIAALRLCPPGVGVTFDDLGLQLKDDWTGSERPWLEELVRGLARDGLVVTEGDEVRLP